MEVSCTNTPTKTICRIFRYYDSGTEADYLILVQASCRSLIVDTLPESQQQLGSAWGQCLSHFSPFPFSLFPFPFPFSYFLHFLLSASSLSSRLKLAKSWPDAGTWPCTRISCRYHRSLRLSRFQPRRHPIQTDLCDCGRRDRFLCRCDVFLCGRAGAAGSKVSLSV